MTNWNRREFIQAALASCSLPVMRVESAPRPDPIVTKTGGTVRARGKDYTWEWTEANDDFHLLDSRGLVIASGKLQPAVMVQVTGEGGGRRCSAGKPAGYDVRGNAVSVRYEGVNGSAKLSVTWRFEDDGMWLDPVGYETPSPEDVVSLHYFAQGTGKEAQPSLLSDCLVVPGANESPALSPILPQNAFTGLKETLWLGHGGANPETQGGQQWALPVHYFCGFHISPYDFQKAPHLTAVPGVELDQLLDAFCCGLAEIPNGDLLIETQDGKYSQVVNYRGDLWGHVRGPGKLALGAKQYWTVGPNYYEAIRRYYLGLLAGGVIRRKANSPHKLEVALAPSFCTYGEQVARDRTDERLDESTLQSIYDEMTRSGMKAKLFVIDAKWEGKWGNLHHSQERLPHFEDILRRIRSDGHYVGLWAAFLRCADPGDLSLTTEHMLHQPDGKPYVINNITPDPYYMIDASQPRAQEALRQLVREFVRRYQPDFVKFDFGYEVPSLAIAAPWDKSWAGERFLAKTLEVIVNAMREVSPDMVVLYYSLSPLMLDFIDLHSPDDLGLCLGDFGLEANRRLFFSSLLGEIGMPTWGSSGYDWTTAPDNWFDTAALGALGSLLSFSGPHAERYAKPERIAKFNGLAQATRVRDTFSIVPIDAAYLGPERGAHASSWARIENGEVVLIALRERCLDGRKGSGKFRDLVTTNTSAVIASKTNDGLARASKLAVVPYGDGEITLQRADQSPARAEATEHYFGGGSKTTQIFVEHGCLRIPLRERAEDGSVVEWIEISFLAN